MNILLRLSTSVASCNTQYAVCVTIISLYTTLFTCMRECTCPSIERGSPLALGKFPSKRSSIFLIDVVCRNVTLKCESMVTCIPFLWTHFFLFLYSIPQADHE